jgi:D-aminopeptidase
MNIKPTAWMKELPTGEGVDRAVRTTTVKEVADDWEQAIPLYTADDLRAAVLAEREACAKVCEKLPETFKIAADEFGYTAEQPIAENYATAIRRMGET